MMLHEGKIDYPIVSCHVFSLTVQACKHIRDIKISHEIKSDAHAELSLVFAQAEIWSESG